MPGNVEITGLELNVTAKTNDTLENLTKIGNALSALQNVDLKRVGLGNFTRQLNNLSKINLRNTYNQINSLNKILTPLANTLERMGNVNINIRGNAAKVAQAASRGAAAGLATAATSRSTATGAAGISSYAAIAKAPYLRPDMRINGSRETSRESAGVTTEKVSLLAKFYNLEQKIAQASETASPKVKEILALFNKLGEAAKKAFSAIASGAAKVAGPLSMVFNPFKGLATAIGDTYKRFTKFLGQLKRIAIYRAIRTALKEISQALKEGIENLYQWSKITGGDFAPAMDRIATAALYVKNSLAAMVSPIITYVAPAIDALADKFVALLNIMNQFFARITGRGTWTEALKYPTEYAETTAGATKKIKDNIQDFDELHILRTPNAGGGGDNLDYNNMFKESEFTRNITDWVTHFRTALKEGAFYQAGQILANALNDLFENKIPWENLGTKLGTKISDVFHFALGFLRTFSFENVGSGFATFLNNAIENVDANAVGSVFAYKIQSIVNAAYGFVTTADWKLYGRKLSDYVTGWFETIDGKKIGQTISAAIHGALDFLESFLEDDYKWDLLAEDIAGLINGIDWVGILTRTLKIGAKIVTAIFRVISNALTGNVPERREVASQIFGSTDEWRVDYLTRQARGTLDGQYGGESIGNMLTSSISESINSANFADVAIAFGNLLSAAFTSAVKLTKFGTDALGAKLASDLDDAVTGSHWEYDENGTSHRVAAREGTFRDIFAEGSYQLLRPILSGLGFRNNVAGYSADELARGGFGFSGIAGRAAGLQHFMNGTGRAGLASTVAGVGGRARRTPLDVSGDRRYSKTPNYDTTTRSVLRYNEATIRQRDAIKELMEQSERASSAMAEHWEKSAEKIESRVTTKFESTRLKIGASITSLTTESADKFNSLGDTMSQSLEGVSNAMVTPLNNIKSQITGAFSEAGEITKEDIGNLSNVMSDSLKGVYDANVEGVEKVSGLWSSLHTNMKGSGNGIIDIAEKVGNSIIDAFNAMGNQLKNYDGLTFPDGTRINLSSLKPANKLSIPRLAEGGLVSSPTIAMVGEAGREAVVPLDNNTGWMDALAERIGGNPEEMALLREQNDLLRQIASKKTGITSREVFDAVRDENRDYFVRTGNNALVM